MDTPGARSLAAATDGCDTQGGTGRGYHWPQMQLIDGRPVYSATDLVGFLECEHLTDLELGALGGHTQRPERVDAELDRIRKRGEQHEERYLKDA